MVTLCVSSSLALLPLLLAMFVTSMHAWSSLTPYRNDNHFSNKSLRSRTGTITSALSRKLSLNAVDESSSDAPAQIIPKQMKKKKLKTFQRYLEIECWKRQDVRDLERVLIAVSDACRQISRIVSRAKTDDLYGVATNTDGSPLDENVQGEVQQKLDVVCNTIMLRAFCGCSSSIAAVASEEEDTPRCCSDVMGSDAFSVGDYVAVFDPIDGSKNIDSSLPVGTIFGIYKASGGLPADFAAFKQNGNTMVAAGYCLYS